MEDVGHSFLGNDSQMTSANFTIDASLAPGDAPQVLESLQNWFREEQAGVLDIGPLASDPFLPSQPAIQLTLAAVRELKASGGTEERLTSRVREICIRLGQSGLVDKNEAEGRNG